MPSRCVPKNRVRGFYVARPPRIGAKRRITAHPRWGNCFVYGENASGCRQGTKYNFDREWIRTTLPSGRAIDGGYDNGGRIQSTIYPEASIAFGYADNTDRVMTFSRTSAADNATQTMSFSYDGFLTTRVASSGASTGEYRYAYDNDFAVKSFALDNVWTSLARDNDGLLTQYGRYTIGRSGPAGAPSSLTDNTLNVGYTYDSFGRLATRTHTIAGQQRC